MKNNKFFLFLIIFFLNFNNANAYIDPVSTSFIIQGIVVVLATILFYLRNPKKIFPDIKKFLIRIFRKKKDDKNK